MLSRMLIPRPSRCTLTLIACAVATSFSVSAETDVPATNPSPAQPINEAVVRVKAKDRVEIHVADLPLATVLRMLSAQSLRNIVASPQARGTVTADLFDVSFHEALEAILSMNGCGYEERGRFIYVYTLAELAQMRAARQVEEFTTRLFRLSYVSVKDVQPLIQPLLSKDGKIAGTPKAEEGLDTSDTKAGGDSHSGPDVIVVFDTASRMQHIEKVIREIDVRPRQVLIEATILRADLGEDNAMGIDFNIVSGVDFEMLNSVSPGVTDLTTGQVPTVELNNTNTTIRTDFNSAVPAGGLSVGIIKDQIALFLRALEQVTDTTILANPKILALNKQRGLVMVGRRDGYLTTTVTETTAVQTVEFLETGTRLVFRPFIGDDGYVRMELHPEDSSGQLNESNLPFETTTEVTTNILVRDGHTILIGGLFRESTNRVRNQVPIVGNIPGLGALFRGSSDATEREEVIILLTVHIVKDNEKYAELGDQLADEISRLRVGMRRGVLISGRERLALAHYHKALQHYKAGRLDKALWDARMALHISPQHLPAMRLKDKLATRHSCDYREGAIRDFIRRRVMGKTGLEDIGPPPPGQENKLRPDVLQREGPAYAPTDAQDDETNGEGTTP